MSTPDLLLAGGYAAAVPTTAMVLRIAWRRQRGLFALLELGTAAIVLGWALKGERFAAWLNAGFGLGFAATWVAVGHVRADREGRRDLAPDADVD